MRASMRVGAGEGRLEICVVRRQLQAGVRLVEPGDDPARASEVGERIVLDDGEEDYGLVLRKRCEWRRLAHPEPAIDRGKLEAAYPIEVGRGVELVRTMNVGDFKARSIC